MDAGIYPLTANLHLFSADNQTRSTPLLSWSCGEEARTQGEGRQRDGAVLPVAVPWPGPEMPPCRRLILVAERRELHRLLVAAAEEEELQPLLRALRLLRHPGRQLGPLLVHLRILLDDWPKFCTSIYLSVTRFGAWC